MDLFRTQYGYDRASNRGYADDQVYKGSSDVYAYDGLHRLTSDEKGSINGTKDDIQANWQTGGQGWTLDPLGNQTAVSEASSSSYSQNTPNKANEYVTRKVKGSENKGVLADEFSSNTAANWSMPSGATDTFDVNTTTAGSLTAVFITRARFIPSA